LKLLSLAGGLNPPKGGDGLHEQYLICRKKAILAGFPADWEVVGMFRQRGMRVSGEEPCFHRK
jgi:hypothetical protein